VNICPHHKRCVYKTKPCPETGLTCDGAEPHPKTHQCEKNFCAKYPTKGRRLCVDVKETK
jgi:hypothetical protein